MAAKLALREGDPGKGQLNWRRLDISTMFIRHNMEEGELALAIWQEYTGDGGKENLEAIIDECVDVANTAMMIADIARLRIARLE